MNRKELQELIVNTVMNNWFIDVFWYKLTSNGKTSTKVHEFLQKQLDSKFVEQLIKENNWTKYKDNPDYQALLVLRWVKNNLTYISDIIQFKQP